MTFYWFISSIPFLHEIITFYICIRFQLFIYISHYLYLTESLIILCLLTAAEVKPLLNGRDENFVHTATAGERETLTCHFTINGKKPTEDDRCKVITLKWSRSPFGFRDAKPVVIWEVYANESYVSNKIAGSVSPDVALRLSGSAVDLDILNNEGHELTFSPITVPDADSYHCDLFCTYNLDELWHEINVMMFVNISKCSFRC